MQVATQYFEMTKEQKIIIKPNPKNGSFAIIRIHQNNRECLDFSWPILKVDNIFYSQYLTKFSGLWIKLLLPTSIFLKKLQI